MANYDRSFFRFNDQIICLFFFFHLPLKCHVIREVPSTFVAIYSFAHPQVIRRSHLGTLV